MVEFENGGKEGLRRKRRPENGYSKMKKIHSYCC
jgi:hypothetical protein